MSKLVRNISLILILVMMNSFVSYCVKPKQKGLVPGSAGIFTTGAYQQIVTYYDIDRDGNIDIVTKSIEKSTQKTYLNVYGWNAKLKEFALWSSLQTNIHLKTVLITNFKVMTNFSIILYVSDPSTMNFIRIIPFVCLPYDCTFYNPIQVPEITANIDPISPGLLGMQGDIGLVYHSLGVAYFLLFTLNDTLTYAITDLGSLINNGDTVQGFRVSFNGDYDGDCLTDIVLLKENVNSSQSSILQFIRGNTENQFQFVYEVVIPQKVQHFTIQDINFDGKNDLILLLASSKLQIHYHKYGNDIKLCNGLEYAQIPYDFEISTTESRQIQRVEFSTPLYSQSLLLFGDFNNDGYDDLSLTFVNDPNNEVPNSQLLENIPCVGVACGSYNPVFIQQTSTLNIRSFSIKQVTGISNVTPRLSFIDIFEDGNLDLMYHAQMTDSSGYRTVIIQPVYNNIDYDAFFLSILLLSSQNTNTLMMNTEYIGGVASLYVTLLSGEFAAKTGNQLSQAGRTLQLPNIRLGLGRTNNYIEQLHATLPRKAYSQFVWSPIIPNSQIFIVPPSFSDPTSEWTLKVMIQPTEKMGLVLVLVLVSLGVLGVVILQLSRKQRQEDKQSQQSFYTLLR